MAILKESFSSKGSEPGFPGSEKLWNRNFPEPGMKKYREIGRSSVYLIVVLQVLVYQMEQVVVKI